MSQAVASAFPRRHDLDALRAIAMLMGIALHAALSFMPVFWPVQDTQQNAAFGLFFSAVHGFRMPLFFMLSGFFTAMLWRRRGLKSLLWHRFRRVFLPCMLGVLTIVPAVNWISWKALASPKAPSAKGGLGDNGGAEFWTAVQLGDIDTIKKQLGSGADVNEINPASGQTPLSLAALHGQVKSVDLLIREGADVNYRMPDGGTALHNAAFLGRAKTVDRLIQHGADLTAKNNNGATPADTLQANWELTKYVAGLFQIELKPENLNAGRVKVAKILGVFEKYSKRQSTGASKNGNLKNDPLTAAITLGFTVPVFHHLWFLWFLCWLVAGFALCAIIVEVLRWKTPPAWFVLSPARFLWLIPLTMIPQWFMGWAAPSFGPDTSVGILPMPHVLIYYAIFFGFGAIYFNYDDQTGRVGKLWPVALPIGLLVVFPLGLEFATGVFGFRDIVVGETLHRPIAVMLQVLYAWVITFACMGLFRQLLSRENKTMRYLSDSAYWLYVAHVPLIIGAQLVVRDWQMPAIVKFTLVCVFVSGFLLITYQTLVRYTWLGTFLNGPRKRPPSEKQIILAEVVEG